MPTLACLTVAYLLLLAWTRAARERTRLDDWLRRLSPRVRQQLDEALGGAA
jgi:hypothetical protein